VASHNAHAAKALPGQVDVNQTEYEAIALAQVGELWSNYGQLGEIWFDGGYGGSMAAGIAKLLKLQTEAVGFGGLGVMPSPVGWIGTESGEPGGAEIWSTGSSGHGDSTSKQWIPKCADTTLQTGDVWFFEPGNAIRPLSDLITVYVPPSPPPPCLRACVHVWVRVCVCCMRIRAHFCVQPYHCRHRESSTHVRSSTLVAACLRKYPPA
jgi:hypothetical protein